MRAVEWLARAVGWLAGPLWIAVRRRGYRRRARALSDEERARLAGFFSDATLGRVRIAECEQIELLPRWAVGWLPERARAGVVRGVARPIGLALDDVVVLERGAGDRVDWYGLLAHELVHVVQFRALGRRGFAARYLAEWIRTGRSVRMISLERDAYALQRRFLEASGSGADLEAEAIVRLGIGQRGT